MDPYELLFLPRAVSMVLTLTCLLVIGDAVALGMGALGARFLLGVHFGQFSQSMLLRLDAGDFLLGVFKAAVFGIVLAIVSIHFGLRQRGGASGVGRAVHAQVVACALGVFVMDCVLTTWLQ